MVTRRILLVSGLAVAVAVFIALAPGHRGWFDVGVYHGTVHHWLAGGDPYDYLRPPTDLYGFTYPPFALLCMLPMALLGWHATVAVSVALNVAASAVLLWWLVDPVARRRGWSRWYAFVLAGCLLAFYGPARDTVSFGQVNLLLLVLVLADWRLLSGRWARYAGIGIGLAAAVKLTPALFVGYLVLTGRWRAAATAVATCAAATLGAFALLPDASREFWTSTLWDTSRVGNLAYVSNQSVQGALARFGATDRLPWVLAVLAVLAVWAYRIRRADPLPGFALTGLAACLVSPVTWVHHLVWLLPALVVLADAGRYRLAAAGYLALSSSMVWLWWDDGRSPLGVLGSNAFVWIALALLVALPLRDAGIRTPEKVLLPSGV
ncbi:glycosyltransferase family 87 protein [Longispora sp. NPDC051575]|uniref:glycosyltransferase family 87 protein n=1 Tax=Longispora sp. NPDC051575 TaxID=3154943 RepID=UPI00342A7138